MEKKIKIISLVFACLGLLSELIISICSFNFNEWNGLQRFSHSMLYNIRCIYLDLFDLTLFSPFSNGIYYNYLNIGFYFLLLISVLIYHKTGHKENKLLRFLYSLLMVSNITSIIFIIHFHYFKNILQSDKPTYLIIISILFCIAYVIISFYILNYFKNKAKIDFQSKQINNETKNLIVLTNKWQRFFHLIVDAFCTVLLFSFIKEFEFIKLPIFNEKYIAILFFITIRIIYYLFFEGLLNTTPAKLLTGSTVINHKGAKPSFSSIIERTLLRFIPFEAFSFFGKEGWHDRLSNTYVAKEKKY